VREEDGELYEKHAGELTRFATVLVGPSGAEDLVSAAMLRVFSSPAWPAAVDARAYLFRAVLLEARQQHRSTQRRLRRERRLAGVDVEQSPPVRPEVLDALRRLTVRQRAAVYHFYWADLPIDEIARLLEVSDRTVERELAAARKRMEVLLR
jgi:RNA polymerase sigma-70 factor (ECF subfamily)